MHRDIQTNINTHIDTYMHTYIDTFAYVHTHIHTYKHAYTFALLQTSPKLDLRLAGVFIVIQWPEMIYDIFCVRHKQVIE